MPPTYTGITPICDGAACYITADYRNPDPDGYVKFFRTLDSGATWQTYIIPIPLEFVVTGAIVVRENLSAPDPLPPDTYLADYAKLTVIWKTKITDAAPIPIFQIGLSDDGGKTWYAGGSVHDAVVGNESGYNIGILNKNLLPFPGYSTLHKNGLDIP